MLAVMPTQTASETVDDVVAPEAHPFPPSAVAEWDVAMQEAASTLALHASHPSVGEADESASMEQYHDAAQPRDSSNVVAEAATASTSAAAAASESHQPDTKRQRVEWGCWRRQ